MSTSVRPPPLPSAGLVLLLGGLTGFSSLSTDMYLPALPAMGHSLGVGAAATQATMAVFLVGLAVGQLFYGPLSDRVGRRPLIVGGLVLYCLATLVCAMAPNITVMLIGRVLQALGAAAGVVLAGTVVRDVYPPEQVAKVMNGFVAVLGLSPILSPAIGGGILLIASWRVIFWVVFVISILILARCYFVLGETRSAATAAQAKLEHPIRSFATLLGNKRLLGYLLVNALACAMLFAYIGGSPNVFIQVFHFSPQAYSGLIAANTIAIIAGAIVSTTVVTKIGVNNVIAAGNGIAIVFCLVLCGFAYTGIGGAWSIWAGIFLVMTTFGVQSANCIAGALAVDPLRTGSISALMNGTPFLAGGVAAWLTGVLWDHTARPMAGVMLGSMVLAAAAYWLLVAPNSPKTVAVAAV